MVNLFPLQQILNPLSLLLIYLVAPILCALLYGTGPSLFASITSMLAFDYFFTAPKYSFSMKDPHEIIGVVVFFITSIVIGQLVKTTRKQNLALQYRLERVSLAEELSKELLTLPPAEQLVEELTRCSGDALNVLTLLRTTILNDISQLMIKYAARIVDAPSFVVFMVKGGGLQVWGRSKPDVEISQNEMAVAEWTYSQGKIAGCGTETLSSIRYFFMPIRSQDETIGVMGIQYDYGKLLPEQHRQLGTINNLTSLAAARWVKI
jgi:two-component system sensor histidine kinase KdpD